MYLIVIVAPSKLYICKLTTVYVDKIANHSLEGSGKWFRLPAIVSLNFITYYLTLTTALKLYLLSEITVQRVL